MHLDVQDLRNFYYRTPLGRAAQRVLRARIAAFWPEGHGQSIAGFGFAVPFLRPYLADARRVTALMPAPQGVIGWPQGLPNISVLCEETYWPVETGHVDKLLVVTGSRPPNSPARCCRNAGACWGRAARRSSSCPTGPGSGRDRTARPFGYGRPYSQSQLETQLKLHEFLPERHAPRSTSRRSTSRSGAARQGCGNGWARASRCLRRGGC